MERLLARLDPRTALRIRRSVARARLKQRKLTAGRRMLPGLVVLGAQRCGTSSLYRYLGEHPNLAASLRKETEYFTRAFHNGERWYRAHFPLVTKARRDRLLAFEATPDYLFHPLAPARIAASLPDARFIVLLRDPTERAISHFQHMTRLGFESLEPEAALLSEQDRIGDARAALLNEDPRVVRDALRFSYVSRGLYAQQLGGWLEAFERERFLILNSRDLFHDTEQTLRQVTDFLGLPPCVTSPRRNYSYARGAAPDRMAVPRSVQEALKEIYLQPNRELYDLLGSSFGWS
ncbi:MAG: sulfotransferase [Actinomycetota bacterium]